MHGEDVVKFIFEDTNDVKAILEKESSDLHGAILNYGLETERFLYVDYKGEEGNEIVDFIMDYEDKYDVELASQSQLDKL